jgi:O-antigen/teichoic acid export membrane protein
MFGTRISVDRGGVAHLRKLWSRSRWFLAEFVSAFLANQGYLMLLPLLLGIAMFGIYRAGASLLGPVMVFFLAGGSVGLPECVRRLRQDGMPGLAAYTPRLTAAVVVLTVAYCGAVAVLAVPVLRFTYGESFTDAAVVTQLVAIEYIIVAVGFGYGVALKAADQMRFLWLVRTATAIVSISAMIVLVNSFGLIGGGLAGIVSSATYVVAVAIGYHRMRRCPSPDATAIRKTSSPPTYQGPRELTTAQTTTRAWRKGGTS